jgi:hypothetical protein
VDAGIAGALAEEPGAGRGLNVSWTEKAGTPPGHCPAAALADAVELDFVEF